MASQPVYVKLAGEDEPLPSIHYFRIVALHTDATGAVQRHDFALHKRAARFCHLLAPLLDASDMRCDTGTMPQHSSSSSSSSSLPPVELPQATGEGCECVFVYLEKIVTCVPTLISKPLKAPLEELTQPWELRFLLENCLGLRDISDMGRFTTSASFLRPLLKKMPHGLDRLLEVAMLSDFLLIYSLRDLTCAFLASIGLSASSESEVLQICGLDKSLTEDDLENLYAQFPFMRPQEA